MTPFLLLLMSHVLGDGVLTSNRLAVLKRNSGLIDQIIAIGLHTGIHAFFAGFLLLVVGRLWLRAALLVFALHFIIDYIRCKVEIRLFGPGRLLLRRSEIIAWIQGTNKDQLNMAPSRRGLGF
jgi:hypothetical protein